jgi:hypothetical protein
MLERSISLRRRNGDGEMKPNLDRGGFLDDVVKELAKRGAETGPYVPRMVVRWNAKVIEFPTPRWDNGRQRAVAQQAMELALKAKQECER